MTTLPSWSNTGPNQYDFAINGIPFYSAISDQEQYVRQTAQTSKQQIDTTKEPGEQSLQAWWYRSQSSFDLGAGIKYMDPVRDELISRRFADSCGVNVFEKGQVTLLNKATRVDLDSNTTVDSGNHYLVGYANGGEEGVLCTNGTTLRKIPASGTGITNVAWGGTTTPLDMASDGGAYYVATAEGVYRGLLPGTSGTKIYSFPAGISRATVGFAKERLVVAGNQHLWAVATTPSSTPSALITSGTASSTNFLPLYSHPSSDWSWTAVADGPGAMYIAGYSGDYSAVYATRIDTNTNVSVPPLLTPYLVAELPRGEKIMSMISYMGTYMILGTNLGVRVAIIDSNGNFVVGPLSIESDTNVTALMARGNFVWAGGSNSDNHPGLYRLDLSQSITGQTLQFPYARDIYADGVSFAGAAINGIAAIGYTGRVAFTVAGTGLIAESGGEKVPSGWLETGRIRFDTAEDKIFQYVKVSTLPVDGSITISWRDTSATLVSLGTYTTGGTPGVRSYDTEGSDGKAHPWLSYRFTLTRGTVSTSNSPVLTSYQVKAQPANVRQRIIKVPLLCFQREQAHGSRAVERSVWDRVKAIEAAEEAGAVVLFQDLGTGERRYCLIEQVDFTTTIIPETPSARLNPGGVLTVTLRTVTGLTA